MRIRTWTVGWLLLNLGVALGCGGPAQRRYEEALEQAPEPAAHAIHDERLAALMRDLDQLRDARLPKSFDVREEADRQASEIAAVARAMAESAARVGASPPAGLDDRRRAEFESLAVNLELLCMQLADEARDLGANQRRSLLAEIDATCSRCHGEFGIPRGVRGND